MHLARRDLVGGWRRNGHENEAGPRTVPVQERIRRLPEALLLTAGYYASRAPTIADLLRRRH